MSAPGLGRDAAAALDAADPLAWVRDEFVVADPDVIYLDGNSLGRLPRRTADRLDRLVRDEWGGRLVGGWEDWVDLPARVGDTLGAHLLGAAPGQVLVADSTTVDLFKLADAALAGAPPGARVLTSDDNFPTDLYVLDRVAQAHGAHLEILPADPVHGLHPTVLAAALAGRRGELPPDGGAAGAAAAASRSTATGSPAASGGAAATGGSTAAGGPAAALAAVPAAGPVALVSLSLVAYRSGALLDLKGITAAAHEVGARVLWDLSHAVGAVPVDLDAAGVDLAVGCTYKYVNAGPGAPAFLYVRRDLQDELRSPVPGWFGAADQFAMDPSYRPAPGIARFAAGTPPVAGVTAVGAGVELLAAAGPEVLRAKSVALTDLLVALADDRLTAHGVRVASPRDTARRGGHVAIAHPHAPALAKALIARAGVVPDSRPPDLVRLAPVPAYTRYVDVWDAVERIEALLASGDDWTAVDRGRVP